MGDEEDAEVVVVEEAVVVDTRRRWRGWWTRACTSSRTMGDTSWGRCEVLTR